MQPISNMQKTPSLQDFEGGMMKVNEYLDAHPLVLVGMVVFLVALIVRNFWNKRKG